MLAEFTRNFSESSVAFNDNSKKLKQTLPESLETGCKILICQNTGNFQCWLERLIQPSRKFLAHLKGLNSFIRYPFQLALVAHFPGFSASGWLLKLQAELDKNAEVNATTEMKGELAVKIYVEI